MTRQAVLMGTVAVVVLAAGATAGFAVFYQPERVDVKISGPLQPTALRPSTWSFQVRNLGPTISDFGIQLCGGDGWVAQHTIQSLSAGCQQPRSDEVILCGSMAQGDTSTISIDATPSAGGTYLYKATFCDCGGGRSLNLLGPDSPRITVPGTSGPRYTDTWTEDVQPEPTASVTVTDLNGNALSGANVIVQGSSVSAATASTGVARLGLGPLDPGIYTVVATDNGYINTGAQITVPDFGDASPVSLQMPWAPPLGTFVWHSRSTLWDVLVVTGGSPDYTLQGYEIEWHCYGLDWSRTDVTVTLGRDQLTYNGLNIPMGPGAISTSFVLNGSLPDTSQPAPTGTCINGQNAW